MNIISENNLVKIVELYRQDKYKHPRPAFV
jgi:hypothetical protein